MRSTTRITTAVTALAIGTLAGTAALTGQEHHPPEEVAATSMPAGQNMAEMMAMCQAMMGGQGMMGMMGGQDMMGSRGMMDPGMMSPQPHMLLRQREALGLTEEQVERLETMIAQASATAEDHMAEMQRLDGDIRASIEAGAPDLDRLEGLLQERADMRVRMQMERVRQSQQATALLTEPQRSNLRYGMKLMHGMMRQMMERMPMEGSGDAGPHQHRDDSGS